MIRCTIDFSDLKVYDNKVTLNYAENIPEGRYWLREGIEELPHNDEQKVLHPEHDWLMRSGENNMMTEGSVTITWDLDDISTYPIGNFIEYVYADTTGNVITIEGNTIKLVATTSFDILEWSDLPAKWTPSSATNAKMTFHEGAELACFLRIDEEPNEWTVKYRDIPEDTTLTLEKEGNICYMFFSKEVTKGDVTLNKYQFYKITSNDITIHAPENTKVVRLHRD